MRSPFTGGTVTLMTEETTSVFRGEKFSYTRYYYRCDDTGIVFTDAESDERGLKQIYAKYREKYGLPTPEEIKSIREQYGLSATIMSKILGIGNNQYGLYENGEMPTKNIGRMIATIKNADVFRIYVDLAKNQLTGKEYERIIKNLEAWSCRLSFPVDNENYAFDWWFVMAPINSEYKEDNVSRWNRVPKQQSFIMA
ncbi:MAG: hypothetical protein IK135_06275 [Bacteroidales bacterium]|nr:hypothetical protein [Bacteroidales bacterium]